MSGMSDTETWGIVLRDRASGAEQWVACEVTRDDRGRWRATSEDPPTFADAAARARSAAAQRETAPITPSGREVRYADLRVGDRVRTCGEVAEVLRVDAVTPDEVTLVLRFSDHIERRERVRAEYLIEVVSNAALVAAPDANAWVETWTDAGPRGLRVIRDALATVAPERWQAERLVEAAWLSRGRIDMGGDPLSMWHAIIDEAVLNERLDDLVAVARAKYPKCGL